MLSLLLFPVCVSTRVLYCDKEYQLWDRSDEAGCRYHDYDTGVLARYEECEGGLVCDGECVPYHAWCQAGTQERTRCGALLYHHTVCRNTSFWAGRPCGKNGTRCTGWWPGQCDYGEGCRDRDRVGADQCLAGGSTVQNISDKNFVCPDLYLDNVKVCATRCNRVRDGCKDDEDEKDCPYKSRTLPLVGILLILLTVTFLLIELIFMMSRQKLDNPQQSVDTTEKNFSMRRELKAMMEHDDDLAKHLTSFSTLILDKKNWELGVRVDSNPLSPYWTEGKFDIEKMPQLRILYSKIRKSPVQCASPFLVYYIQNIVKDEVDDIDDEGEALSHYCHALIYNVLEREYLESTTGFNKDVDISIKQCLTTRHSPDFYGQVFPYFQPLVMLRKLIPSNGTIKTIKLKLSAWSNAIPESAKYIGIVSLSVIGWYVDFIKDIFIANDLSFLFTTFWDFKSQIVIILWVTVFLSQTIIGFRILLIGPSKIFGHRVRHLTTAQKYLANIIFFCIAPLTPALLLYVNKRYDRKIRLREKTLKELFAKEATEDNCKQQLIVFQNREEIIEEKRKLEAIISTSFQIDNVLENTPQLLIQLLIILMSASLYQLPWVTGIEAVFDTREEGHSSMLFYFSIGWSLKSICFGLVSTHLFQKEYSVGDTGKVLSFLLFFLGSSSRLLAVVFFFCPYLGLFNLMLPYSMDMMIGYSDELRESIGEEILSSMHHRDWYSGLSFYYAGILFMVFPFIHMILVMVYKSITIKGFLKIPQDDSVCGAVRVFYRRLIHCLNGLLVPIIWKDWDERDNKPENDFYPREWEKVRQEYRFLTTLFCLENILLCIPLVHTCARIIYRYHILVPTQEEEHVLLAAKVLVSAPVLFIVLALLQFKLFVLYNLNGHPWSRLLNKKKKILTSNSQY